MKKDVKMLVEEMQFMYGYDQTMREYISYKTFDKSETDSIESLSESLREREILKRQFESDNFKNYIWINYINPKDAEHTERMIEIIRKYGFPTIDRIKRYYKNDFVDSEFNPLIILIHSPRKYWAELKEIVYKEHTSGRINQCEYGYLLWQFTGRESFQPMLENGYEMVRENGNITLKSTCK
ncbi:hypothetical protein [Galbibacter sp. BG1]|uniref:hypothetical protein n=1 Tax=Galbibacter sp. BG1 TaxID=1170699 RepID=UPI0021028C72|nr:hypothetical protein [Galbibacter sp. BG1]